MFYVSNFTDQGQWLLIDSTKKTSRVVATHYDRKVMVEAAKKLRKADDEGRLKIIRSL